MAVRKTSLYLDEELLREAKMRAVREGRSMTAVVEECLRQVLLDPGPRKRAPRPPGRLPTALYRGDGRPNDPDDIYS